MADTSLTNGRPFVFCTQCESENLIFNQNKPPKFCSECGGRLPLQISSVTHSTKADDASLEKQKPHSEKSFSDEKLSVNLSLNDKLSMEKPKSPSDKCNDKLSITKPLADDGRSPSNKPPDDDKSLSDKPPDNDKSLIDKPPDDDKSLSDKPTDDDKSLSDKPPDDDKSLSDKPPDDDKSLSEKPPDDDKSLSDKPPDDDKSLSNKPPDDDKSLSDKPPDDDKSLSDKPPDDDKSLSDKPPDDDKSLSDKPPDDDKSLSDKPPDDDKSLSDMPPDDDKSLSDEPPDDDKSLSDKPPDDDKSLSDKPPDDDKSLSDKPPDDDKSLSEKPPDDDKSLSDKPPDDDKSLSNKPPDDDKSLSDKPPDDDKSLSDKPPDDDKSLSDKPPDDDKSLSDKPPDDDKSLSDKPPDDDKSLSDMPPDDDKSLSDEPPDDDKSLSDKPPDDDKSLSDKPPDDDKSLSDKPPDDDKSLSDKPPDDGKSLSDKPPDDDKSLSEKPPDDDKSLSDKPPDDDKSLSDKPPDDGKSLSDKPPDDDKSLSDKPPDDNKSLSDKLSDDDKSLSDKPPDDDKSLSEKPPDDDKSLSDKPPDNDKSLSEKPPDDDKSLSDEPTDNDDKSSVDKQPDGIPPVHKPKLISENLCGTTPRDKLVGQHGPNSFDDDVELEKDGGLKADTRSGGQLYLKKKDDEMMYKDKRNNKKKDAVAKTPTTHHTVLKLDPPELPESVSSLFIEFHVLLSKAEWFWDESAKVYLYFSHHLLGNFQCCYGPMTVAKESADNDIIELVHIVNVPTEAFNKRPPCRYKYCVFSDAVTEFMKSPFEFIYGNARDGNPIDRLLLLNTQYINKTEIYKKIDGSMHPEFNHDKLKELESKEGSQQPKEDSKQPWWKTFVSRGTEAVANLFKSRATSSDGSEMKSLPAVKTYLAPYSKFITGEISTNLSPLEATNKIVYIIESLIKSYFNVESNHRCLLASDVKKETSKWLMETIDSFGNKVKWKQDIMCNVLQSTLILLLVIRRLDNLLLQDGYNYFLKFLEERHYKVLFQGLCTIPDWRKNTKSWPDFSLMEEQFFKSNKIKADIVHVLTYMHRQALQFRQLIPEVLFSFPIYHFAKGVWQPFKDVLTCGPELNRSFSYFKEITTKCFSSLIKYLDYHPYLFAVDPLLVHCVVRMSPLDAYSELVAKVPLFILLAALKENLSKGPREKELKALQLFIATGNKLKYSKGTRIHLIMAVKNALKLVVAERQACFCQLNDHLCHMVQLFLLLREKLFAIDDHEIQLLMLNDWDLMVFVRELIQAIISSKNFGAFGTRCNEEIKVWSKLDGIQCPKTFEKDWRKSIEQVIKERIMEMKLEVTNLLFTIDPNNMPDFLMEIILTHITTHYDNYEDFDVEGSTVLQHFLKRPDYYNQGIVYRVLNLLSEVIKRRYPTMEDITESNLMEWKMWPSILRMIVANIELHQEHHIIAMAALSQLDGLCKKICNKSITLRSLDMIKDQLAQLKRLCDAVKGHCMPYAEVQPRLQECFQLQSKFMYFRAYISTLLGLCGGIYDGGLTRQLQKEFNAEYRDVAVNQLFVETADPNQPLRCIYFTTKDIPHELVKYLHVMGNIYHNDLFETCWRKQCKMCNHLSTFNRVYKKVCMPVLEECEEILLSLQQRTMTLENVDKYFQKFQQEADIENNLNKLCQGIQQCFPSTRVLPAKQWLHGVVPRIQEYKRINGYISIAMTISKLKKSMKLYGDFTAIDMLAQQMDPAFKKQQLSAINRELIKAGEDLIKLSSFPNRCECLKVLSESTDLIKWLRLETGSVRAVANFVEVANSTTGEGDFNLERLSMLHSVATGYSSLIFGMKSYMGFAEFYKKCINLWRALEENPKLPQYLKYCRQDLEWYKEIKKIQGSVEVTSIDQVEDINKHGAYTICCEGKKLLQSFESAVSLKIIRVDAAKKIYSFNDLRDLESKLVLIRGRGTKGGAEIDRFLDVFHLVCRIAEALCQLQNVGHTKYITWSLTFTCLNMSVEKLTEQAANMENELKNLLDSINEQRIEFHALNYFTTQQLLQIRHELGNLKQDSTTKVTPRLHSLLSSFSLHITSDDIKNVVEAVCALFNEQEAICEKQESTNETFKVQLPLVSRASVVTEVVKNEHEAVTDEPMDIENSQSELKLAIENLSKEEEELFEQLQDDLEFSDIVCYNAVKHVFLSNSNNKLTDAMTWCFKNSSQYDDNTTASVSTDHGVIKSNKSATVITEEPLHKEITKNTQPKEIIDIKHVAVQKLIQSNFTPDLAIKGARKFNGNFEQAFEWCLKSEKKSIEPQQQQQSSFVSFSSVIPMAKFDVPTDPVSTVWDEHWDEESVDKYMDMLRTATILEQIHNACVGLPSARSFPKILCEGEPNLLIVTPGDVLKTVLSLYMKNPNLPLPSSAEVCICTSTTTAEEVELLWHRAMKDPGFNHIYCLVHAERLSYQVCEAAFKEYDSLSQGINGYRVVVICSLEDEERAHVVSKLHQYRREYPPLPSTTEIANYLKRHFVAVHRDSAAMVDPEMCTVRVVASNASGMGKSLYVKRLAQKLKRHCQIESEHVIVPIHGPVVNADTVMTSLNNHTANQIPTAQIIHLDIASSVLSDVDTLLFSLLILRSLTDSKGQVWHSLPLQYYVVEVTYMDIKFETTHQKLFPSTMSLLTLLPKIDCQCPLQVLQQYKMQKMVMDKTKVFMDAEVFRSAVFQRSYQYLRRSLDFQSLAKFSYKLGNVEGSVPDVLGLLLEHCGVRNPSWAELNNFVKFLNIQLHDCERSIYCNEAYVGDVLQGFKQFIVKFMIRMSRDFATPSLKAAVIQAENEDIADAQKDFTEQYKIVERKAWEKSFHPYIFFNDDHVSLTFLGFKITPDGNLVDPKTGAIVEEQLLTKELRYGLVRQRVNFEEDYNAWDRFTMIEHLCYVMGIEFMSDPDDSYVLTVDNMKKMLAIQMRFRCNIPVVIMGETGCGKTRLIRYMCNLKAFGSGRTTMLMMKVHGGITEQDIKRKVEEVRKLARENKKANPPVNTVLFFDEANTTEAIGLIKEIMCDRRLNGEPLPEDVKFIAACNPYRKHSKEMIQRLENAGLGFYVKSTKTLHKLGSIPLRQLVYRVLALPPSMQPLVYDFGQLTNVTEKDYTVQIVKDRIQKNAKLKSHPDRENITNSVSNVLAACQEYMRKREDECSFVSLRDVERAMIVFEWFYDKTNVIEHELRKQEGYKPLNTIVRSLIMSVAVCYHARLQERDDFERYIVTRFLPPFSLPHRKQFVDEIFKCQTMFLRQMELGPNIASNAALRENVFMMVVCIELRIPLFLVGKPGSSKSLAKSIIADSMQGRTSHTTFLRELKQVKMFSYQCSQLSTPASVLEVFGTAKKFQRNRDTSHFVSVVVLDEVGLAEDSPSLPLKALHPLLEDGTSGADSEIIDREKRVAFIGISNWALDPAKMNRGVMVTRGKPDEEELILSAKGICSVEESDKYRDRLENYFKPLATSYLEICEKQQPKEFFGLRDFYSLIKMLYWMIKKTNQPLTMKQLEHAVKRNFGGLDNDEVDALDIFKKKIHIAQVKPDITDPTILSAMDPDCSAMGLIKTSLATKETSWHGESRYLLFLTENYAALHILQLDLLFDKKNPPFVLFGSSFPKDREYTQVCRNINQIKICMETGRKVILLNLENLYESLYDALNQYYTQLADKRYVDLGLQTHRIKCRVHDDFKLILIAEKDKVYEEFPTPLINRLEKHFVVTSTVLDDAQKELLTELETWARGYACIGNFKVGDAFVGYQEDTPAAVVFQVTHLLKNEKTNNKELFQKWKMKAMALSKRLLLETASPDSLVRLKGSSKHQEMNECVKIYFEEQHHASLCDLVKAKLLEPQSSNEGFLLHVTTHSHLLSRVDVNLLCHSLGWEPNQVICFLLQEFDTEMDFSYKIRPIFRRSTGEDCLLIVQCDAGHLNIDLIACARHRIIDERVSAQHINTDTNNQYVPLQATHVAFIVQLPKQAGGTKFVGFQGGQWYSVHIDDLSPPKDLSFDIPNAFNHSVSEIFGISSAEDDIAESNLPATVQFDASKRLHNLIQKATSRLQDNEEISYRTTQRIELLMNLIPINSFVNKGERRFHHILIEHISVVLQERDSIMLDSKDWALSVSMQSKKLRQGGTFRNCLSRKFDEIVVPIFAEILSVIDKNFNLNLIYNAPDQSSLIARLWLDTFADKKICCFNYNDMVAKDQKQQLNYRSRVPGIGALLASPRYVCKFPFSWLVKDAIDSQWDNASALAEQNEVTLDVQLNDLVASTPLGEYIKSEVFIRDLKERVSLYQLYLSDFISSVYRTTRNSEFKLVYLAIDSMVLQLAPNADLLKSLVAVHIAYNTVKAHIQQFHQLVSLEPGIVDVLISTVPYPTVEMNLAYFGVQEMLEVLTPNFDKWDHSTVQNWIKKLHKAGNSIETVLSFKTEPNSEAEALKIANRYNWQRMCVIKMFAEHISLKFTENEIVVSAKRLWTFLAKPNFQSKDTLDKIKLVMDSLDSKVRKVWKINELTYYEGDDRSQQELKHIKFRHLCRSFFMEVISTLCFERNMLIPPEPDLIMMLMNIVFAEGNMTRILSPFDNEKTDPAPVIRSNLLQLLLEFSSTNVRTLLTLYFVQSQDLAKQDEELYVLCVQCFEDAVYKEANQILSSETLLKFVLNTIIKNHDIYQTFSGVVTVEYLEAVASLRYGLSMTASYMAKCYQTDDYYTSLQPVEKRILDRLFNEVKRACLSGYYPQSHEFLIKVIVRQYGMQFLKLLVDRPSFAWLIPAHLKSTKQERSTVDPFVLYGNEYKDIRQAFALSLCGSDVAELQAAIRQLASNDSLVIPLAFYQQLTIQAKQVPDKMMKHLTALVQQCTVLNNEMNHIISLLIQNGHGYHLAKIQTDYAKFPHQLYLRDIVIHSAIVFTHKKRVAFLQLFVNLLYNPAAVKRAYFPTMSDDSLFQAMNVLAGNYYTCPKGHPYHIGDCGGAVFNATCPECGATIGGVNYQLATGNVQILQRGDKTQIGHILGSPDKRSWLPEPERGLSPSGCALLRLLLHAVLVWSSSNGDDSHSAELVYLVHPKISGDHLAQFFWEHLQRDMELLSKSLNLNKDDTALIVHSVLRHISQLQQYPTCDASFANKATREKWEIQFYQTCAQPVLQDVHKYHRQALDLIATDNSQEHDTLFFTIYEKLPVRTGDIQPAMWRYRARITLEHLTHALQQNTSKDLVVLKEFLRLESVLRITQYLPDILYLQKVMFDHFHQRLDQGNALNMTIRDYLESLNNDHLKHVTWKLMQSFNKAWIVVKQHLVNYGRFKVPEEYVTAMPVITKHTNIAYLIPTTNGEGICSTVLLDFLVVTHNSFISYYHKRYPLAEKYSDEDLMKNSIPLSQLQECHLLNYESHIISVVLSHCHHSLEVGKGSDIQYDLQALEKKIVDRFIQGKPLIQFENAPRVVYRKDVHDVQKFMDVRQKVPQDSITMERQKIILAELQSPQRLSEVLDVIDVVLGFLASAGAGNSRISLGDYVKKTLKMTRRTLPKSIQECTLANTLSLWDLLSVEQAKQLTLINQEPFDKVDDVFKEELDESLLERLNRSLIRFPLDQLLAILHEFIITHVSHVSREDQGQSQWPLKDTLSEFLDRQSLPEFKELQHFPNDLLVCHVTMTWKEIVQHQSKISK